jgi:hypothetical protein
MWQERRLEVCWFVLWRSKANRIDQTWPPVHYQERRSWHRLTWVAPLWTNLRRSKTRLSWNPFFHISTLQYFKKKRPLPPWKLFVVVYSLPFAVNIEAPFYGRKQLTTSYKRLTVGVYAEKNVMLSCWTTLLDSKLYMISITVLDRWCCRLVQFTAPHHPILISTYVYWSS